jgi:hypothetical protein
MMLVPFLISEAHDDPASDDFRRAKTGEADCEFDKKLHGDHLVRELAKWAGRGGDDVLPPCL